MSISLGSLLLFVFFGSLCLGQSPWDPDFIIEHHLASKCPYYPLGNLSDFVPPRQQCIPIHLNLIARHGNRNPGDGDIEEYMRIEETVKQYQSSIAFDWLKDFKNPVPYEDEGKLVLGGQLEHYNLAKKMEAVFPSIFSQTYNSDIYFLRSTQEQRAMMSADSFSYGFLEGKGQIGLGQYEPKFILSDTESQDYILKYYDLCSLYTERVDENDTAKIETELYLAKILPSIAERLTTVITTDSSWKLTFEDVLAFHSLCQTQVAILGIKDQACPLFLQEELEALEYWEDLDDYYGKSYAYDVNYKMTIPLLQDLVQSMDDAVTGESRQKTNFRFAHSATVVPLHAVFGLYNDGQDLKHDSPNEFIQNRKFRTSQVSPMGTNYIFALYNCEDNDYRVQTFQNEKQVLVKGCDEYLCPLENFTNALQEYLTTDFDIYCQNKK